MEKCGVFSGLSLKCLNESSQNCTKFPQQCLLACEAAAQTQCRCTELVLAGSVRVKLAQAAAAGGA